MLAAVGVNAQSEIAWQDQGGMQIAKSQNKPAMIIFYGKTCPACVKQAEVFVDTRVINMSKNFVPLAVSTDESRGFGSQYGIRYVPTIVFTNSQGEEVYRTVGYRDPDTLMGEMQKALELSDLPQTTQKQTPGFGVVTALVSLFICGLWTRRRHVK